MLRMCTVAYFPVARDCGTDPSERASVRGRLLHPSPPDIDHHLYHRGRVLMKRDCARKDESVRPSVRVYYISLLLLGRTLLS
jgi:hypothetical protein